MHPCIAEPSFVPQLPVGRMTMCSAAQPGKERRGRGTLLGFAQGMFQCFGGGIGQGQPGQGIALHGMHGFSPVMT